jgi:transmembrane sensor
VSTLKALEENEQMKISKYILLFHKRATNKLNEGEQSEYNDWLQVKENAQLEQQLEKVWELSSSYKSTYEPDFDKALARFQTSLAEEKENPTTAKVVTLSRRFLTIAASLLFLVAVGWWGMTNGSDSAPIQAMSTGEEETQIVDLPDGTQVVLNENSEIIYPKDFNGQSSRVVSVSGEAYFKVHPDAEHPFIIETPATKVTVLGTAFNLRAYPEEDFTEVEVEEGKVAFEDQNNGQELTLLALDKGIYRADGSMNKETSSLLNAHSWRTQTLTFRKTKIEQAIQDIERHYEVDIDLVGRYNSSCTFSGIYDDDKLEDLLEVLRLTFGATITKTSANQLVIEIPSCS